MDTDRFKLGGQNLVSTKNNVLIGNAFAFLDADALKGSELSWLAKLLGHKSGAPLIVSIAGPETVELSGLRIAPLKLDQFFLQSIVSDKNLYRAGRDTINLLVLSPMTPNSSVEVTLSCNGSVISRHLVELGANGEGSLKLRDLLVGDYQLTFEGEYESALESTTVTQETPQTNQTSPSAYGAGVRAQVLEVIVRQAISGADWRSICAGPMQVNGISPEDVEREVNRRRGTDGRSSGTLEAGKKQSVACEFTVAEYRLVPLVASLTSSAVGAADSLDVVLHLESFGVAVNGKVRLSLMDRQTVIGTVSATAVEGAVPATFQLKGTGPHSIAVQLEAEPSKTATVPLRGSRETERKNTVFSALGTEVVGSLLPISATTPVRGIYLKEGALKSSPITLYKVDDDRARLTINSDVSTMKVVVVDPTFPTQKAGAVDVDTAPHPGGDPIYKEAEEKFKAGKYAEACEKFRSRCSQFDSPHPYYTYWMACCYAKAGQVDEAVKALRQSIADGWTDFGHMERDDDLSSLRDYEPYQKLLSGGRTEISFSNISAGETIEVAVVAPMSLLLIGAMVEGNPWEGWASVVTPSTVSAQVTVPEVCTPGERLTIKFETESSGSSIYAIIKDARLISADTPEMRLAAAIKKYVESNGARLEVGAPTKTLKSILSTFSVQERKRGLFGGVDTFETMSRSIVATGSPWDMPLAAPSGMGGNPQQRPIFNQEVLTWGTSDGPPPPGAAQFSSGGWEAPVPSQSQDFGPAAQPAGSPSGEYQDAFGGSYGSVSAFQSSELPAGSSPRITGAGSSGGRSMGSSLKSLKSEVAASVAVQQAPAKKPLAAVLDEPEVLYAGFVTMKKGKGSVKVKLPDSFSNYIVECFAISGMHWASKETRFRAAKESYVQLTTPVFATKKEPGVGILNVGSNKNARVRVLFDGEPISLYDQNGTAFNGELTGPSNSYSFSAPSGHFEAILETDGAIIAKHVKRVDEPGKLKRAVRSFKVLTAGESIALKDDSSFVGFQVLPGVENEFSLLLDATADYSHCCCEQTAAKIISGCVMYLQSNGDDNRKKLAESIIIAGIKREQSMWLKGKGFKSYPHMASHPDQYVGPKAARYLWNVGLLESGGNGNSISKDLKAAIASGLEMAQDTSKAYKIAWPPTAMRSCEDAYNALCFNPSVDGEATLRLARAVNQNGNGSAPDPFFGRSVGIRLEQAFAAATLLRKGASSDMKLALNLANTVISHFNEYGRLYSTVDSVAAIALMTELQKAGITKSGGTIELNGRAVASDEAITTTDAIKSLKVLEGALTVAIDRTVEEDWKKFEAGVPLRISLEKNGEHSRAFSVGDAIDLVVTLEQGYVMGDLLWVALPDALSRVVGGGQVKLFALDFAGENELRVSLAATGITEGVNRAIQEQSLAVCVRNMFNEERAGNPGLIKISVRR